jgi:NAD(P)-dependent dehydrogenase (short-subunit alcohol dehydrogenase family)
MELKDKVVLVTGSSGGMGQAILAALSQESSDIIAQYRQKKVDIGSTEKVSPIQTDFLNISDITKMFQTIKDQFGHLDVLINTVGIEESAPDQLDTSKWENIFQVNLFGAIECARQAIPLMEKNGGVIVNIASLAGIEGIVFKSSLAYSVSKAALIKFTENLALMMSPTIRAFTVTPGYTETPIWDGFSAKQKKECADAMPIERFIQPDEIAHFILNAVKNDAITGGNYIIDGGLRLKNVI